MPHRTEALERVRSERKLAALIAQADFKLGKQSLEKLPEYGIKLRLLKAMDFVSDSEVRALCMLFVLCSPATHTSCWNRHSTVYAKRSMLNLRVRAACCDIIRPPTRFGRAAPPLSAQEGFSSDSVEMRSADAIREHVCSW